MEGNPEVCQGGDERFADGEMEWTRFWGLTVSQETTRTVCADKAKPQTASSNHWEQRDTVKINERERSMNNLAREERKK